MIGKIKHAISYTYRLLQLKYLQILNKALKRNIIILTGCGRSGTTFSSKWLTEAGLKIGHERLLKDGISSWFLVSSKKNVLLGPSLYDLRHFKKSIIHQVRNPLNAIASMQASGHLSWKFLANEIPINYSEDSKILMAMKYYYYWNLKAEEIADVRIQAEKFTAEIIPFLQSRNISLPKGVPALDQKSKVNTRSHNTLTWDDLINADSDLAQKIKDLGIRYGYE